MRKSTILVDMDGVLCNYKKALKDGLLAAVNPNEEKYPQSRIGFFSYLEPMPVALESMEKLQREHDVWICSRPSFPNLNCYTEKAIWVRKHLGYEMQKKLMLVPNKSMVIGDFLIDDSLKDGQSEFRGELLHFGSDLYPNWPEVLKRFNL